MPWGTCITFLGVQSHVKEPPRGMHAATHIEPAFSKKALHGFRLTGKMSHHLLILSCSQKELCTSPQLFDETSQREEA